MIFKKVLNFLDESQTPFPLNIINELVVLQHVRTGYMTLKELNSTPPHAVFRYGIHKIDGVDFYWVAKRGLINDWALYMGNTDNYKEVTDLGEKQFGEIVKELVPGDQDFHKRYRG